MGQECRELPSISVTGNEFTLYDETFTFDTEGASATGIIFFGPNAGVSFAVDKVSLVPLTTTKPEPINTIVDFDFELEAQGWGGYFTTSVAFSRTPHKGSYSLVSYNRRYNYSGPAITLTGLLQSDNTYTLDTYVRTSNGNSSERIAVYAYIVDDAGQSWQKLVDTTVPSDEWTHLYHDFSIDAVGDISQLRIHVMGPSASTSIRLDDFSISQ